MTWLLHTSAPEPRSQAIAAARSRGYAMLGAVIAYAALGLVAAATVADAPTRSLWLAPTYQFLGTSAFEPSSRHGFGLSGAYEFHVSPRFNLGLAMAYRRYPGEKTTQQIGYGATLKHFFDPRWAEAAGVYPFFAYGLLLQQSFVEGRSGSAVSHDTRLGVGSLFRAPPVSMFVDVGGHYSRLEFFQHASRWIPYLEVAVGWVVAF